MKTSTSGVSKYQHTEFHRYGRVESRLKDCYSLTFTFKLTFDQYIERRRAIRDSDDYNRLTSYYKGKLDGLDGCLFHSLFEYRFGHQAPLMFAHIGPDMHLFVEGDDSWLAESDEYKTAMVCIHMWRESWVKDRSFRPF